MTLNDNYSPAAHYDRVTRAWSLLLGDELHYGLFERGNETLATATRALTSAMEAGAQLSPRNAVLDVGCGTGTQACRLAREHDVSVLGISTSGVGIEAAQARANSAGIADRARFELRDGTNTGLADSSFDRVWILESSHLMPDRSALIQEAARVLQPGGRVVWCDIVRLRDIPFAELRARRDEFATLRAAFGEARMDTPQMYRDLFANSGLEIDVDTDLTDQTRPTFDRWRANATANATEVAALIGSRSLDEFRRSAEVLYGLWVDGTLGYRLMAAKKPGRPR